MTRMTLTGLASIIAVGATLTVPAFAQGDVTGLRSEVGFDQGRSHATNPFAADLLEQRAQIVRPCSDSPARC